MISLFEKKYGYVVFPIYIAVIYYYNDIAAPFVFMLDQPRSS